VRSCGEILKQTKSGVNYAAEIRQGSATSYTYATASAAGRAQMQMLRIIPELYDPRATFRLIKWIGFAGLSVVAIALACSGLALVIESFGYNLMESAVVLGSAGTAIFGLDLILILYALTLTQFGKSLATSSNVQSESFIVFKEGKIRASAKAEQPYKYQKNSAAEAALPQKQQSQQQGITLHWITAVERGRYCFSFFASHAALILAVLSFLAFLFLPQYRVGQPLTGYRSTLQIFTGFVHRDIAFASAESLVALLIPAALLMVSLLIILRQPRQAMLAWLITIGLFATLFLVNYTKDRTGYTHQQRAMLGFEYGFWIVITAVALIPPLMMFGNFKQRQSSRSA
jgi:hypothetical protein